MSSLAENAEIPIPCPKCGKELEGKLGRLSREKRITCPECGPIEITGDGLRKIRTALADLERQFKSLSRTIKLKL